MDKVVKKKVVEATSITINRDDFIEIMGKAGVDIPENARIFIEVPSGGDWSNTELSLVDSPIKIKYKEICDHEEK